MPKLRGAMLAVALLVALAAGMPAWAVRGDLSASPAYGDMTSSIALMLASRDRLELPIERIRAAVKAHYVYNGGTVYWVGTGRMTPFIQRLIDAEDDGLNPADYP